MNSEHLNFNEHDAIHELKHFLPAQAPLKDFIHHNTLHAFQDTRFYDALRNASERFGYKVLLSLEEYRSFYAEGRIREDLLIEVIKKRKGRDAVEQWKKKLIFTETEQASHPRIGGLRSNWKRIYQVDLDSLVHPILFRILCSYLDQGIAIWKFPVWNEGFLTSIRKMERNSFTSFFRRERARKLLMNDNCSIPLLLKILIGDESLYKQYLFDQQFAHQGWSGMVSSVEDHPESLLDQRNITLHDLIVFELLLEIDTLDFEFGEIWSPLSYRLSSPPPDLFENVADNESYQILFMLHEAFEWTYYDEVLAGIKIEKEPPPIQSRSFQGIFCLDDRSCGMRRSLEKVDDHCETFGTPGFFGVEFYFQPEHGKFYTKVCPAPITPKYLIKETDTQERHRKDPHFTKHSHSFIRGWLISQTLGFWSAFRLFLNVFRPSMSPATASSFQHMDKVAKLTIENKNPDDQENGLQIGFTIPEMAQRVEELLMSIGLIKDFAPLVYVVGHGSSSVNNPHFAAYDCGACAGRPGSVNARVVSYMANHAEVRKILGLKGINIPDTTLFMGGLHDTTRDEIIFYDEDKLSSAKATLHEQNKETFLKALDINSKERARRFELINNRVKPEKVHDKVRKRSVSLFEPRPELNHATNALCIIGRRAITKNLFLDRRAFLNSYDYRIDPEGKYLLNILRPAAPVCGGINLEYFFSRVDNQKLGAGTKLPHNVMGLFGVANGIDGDLRPGLPSQMIEVHDPVRLLVVVEHFPDVVLKTIQRSSETYEWFGNEWLHLVSVDPETRMIYVFRDGNFSPYEPFKQSITEIDDITPLVETHHDNLPVLLLHHDEINADPEHSIVENRNVTSTKTSKL